MIDLLHDHFAQLLFTDVVDHHFGVIWPLQINKPHEIFSKTLKIQSCHHTNNTQPVNNFCLSKLV